MSAVISECGTYRYHLTRQWGHETDGAATFVMLNPSTADAAQDDPTIRRCIGFAKAGGLGGLVVVNLYALRSTDPKGLWRHHDPVGRENDRYLTEAAEYADDYDLPLVAAWGSNARPSRVSWVCSLPGMERLTALGVTKGGAPRHPLYLRADATPESWRQA